MIQNEMVIRIDADIRDVKAKFSELQTTMQTRLSGIEGSFKQLKTSISGIGSSLRNTYLEIGRYVGAFVATYYGVKSLIWGFENLVKITDTYAQQTAEVAALLTTYTKVKPGEDLGQVFKEWYEYAGAIYEKLAEMDEQLLGTREEAMQMVSVFAQHGIVIDINNKKQLEGFRDIHNAIKIITQDQQQERQLRQELNALIQGQVDQSSRLMQILRSMDPNIKEHVQKWREQGTLIENVGNLLKGFAQAVGTVERLYEAQKTTLQSILNDILRKGLTPLYEELIERMKTLQKWLRDNGERLVTWIAEKVGWVIGLFYAIRNVWNLILERAVHLQDALKTIWSFLKSIGEFLVFLGATAFGGITKIFDNMVASAKMTYHVLEAMYYISTLQISKAKEAWEKAKELEAYIFRGSSIEMAKKAAEKTQEGFLEGQKKAYESIQRYFTKKTEKVPSLDLTKPINAELEKLRERWEETKISLEGDIEKGNLDEFGRKIIELETKVKKLKDEFKELPEALKYLEEYRKKMISILIKEAEEKIIEAEEKILKEYSDLILDLESKMGGERERRIKAIEKDWIQSMSKLASLKAYLPEEEYERIRKIIDSIAERRKEEEAIKDALKAQEERLSQILFELDIAEKKLTKPKLDIIKERIGVYTEFLDYYKRLREVAEEAKDISAIFEIEEKMRSIRGKIIDLEIEQLRRTGSLIEGIKWKLKELGDDLFKPFEAGMSIVERVVESMKDRFTDFFDYTSERFLDLRNLIKSILQDVYKMLVRTLIVEPLVSGITGYMKNVFALSAHAGAIVGSGGILKQVPAFAFLRAPRLHFGLAPDEYPAILQKGETVLPKGARTADVNVKIVVNNETGVPSYAQSKVVSRSPEEIVVGLWLKAYENNTSNLRNILGGR